MHTNIKPAGSVRDWYISPETAFQDTDSDCDFQSSNVDISSRAFCTRTALQGVFGHYLVSPPSQLCRAA